LYHIEDAILERIYLLECRYLLKKNWFIK